MLNSIFDIIFPRQCFGCGKWGNYICPSCAKNIDFVDRQLCAYCENFSQYGLTHSGCLKLLSLDGLFVLANYTGIIRQTIHKIKYREVFAASDEVAKLILSGYHKNFNFDYLVPVPLSKKREKIRGFNQAEKIAKELKFKKCINLLSRTKDTKPQFDLNMEERKTNVKNAFSISPNLLNHSLKKLSFCLVDDVATTGSTLFECAKVLKEHGAEKIYAITLARGS